MNFNPAQVIEQVEERLTKCGGDEEQLSNCLKEYVADISVVTESDEVLFWTGKEVLMHLIAKQDLRPAFNRFGEDERRRLFKSMIEFAAEDEVSDFQNMIEVFGRENFARTAFETIHTDINNSSVKFLCTIATAFTAAELEHVVNKYEDRLVEILRRAFLDPNLGAQEAASHFIAQPNDVVQSILKNKHSDLVPPIIAVFRASREAKMKVIAASTLAKTLENCLLGMKAEHLLAHVPGLSIVLKEFIPLLREHEDDERMKILAFSLFNLMAKYWPVQSIEHYREYLSRMILAGRDHAYMGVRMQAMRGFQICATPKVDEGIHFRPFVKGALLFLDVPVGHGHSLAVYAMGSIILFQMDCFSTEGYEWYEKWLGNLPLEEDSDDISLAHDVHDQLIKFVRKKYVHPFLNLAGLKEVIGICLKIINSPALARQETLNDMKVFIIGLWNQWSEEKSYLHNKLYRIFASLSPRKKQILERRLGLSFL